MPKLISMLLLIVGVAVPANAAARLLNYESRVVRAAEQVERIKTDRAYSEEGISYIKRLLPRSEPVEYEGHEVSVDNSWLYALLDSYAAEKDPQQQVAKLNEIAGRLRALDEHLRRAEAASMESANSKEEIKEILSRPAFQPERETAVGAFIKRVLRKMRAVVGEIMLGLQHLLEKIFGAGASAGWLSNVVLLLVIAVALFLIVSMVRRTRAPRSQRRRKKRIVLGEEITSDSSARELAEAGLAAARAGDFRTAVRKLYVSLLYELSERSLIELEDSATNHEYLKKASRFKELLPPMTYLTDRFDYVWYGMFPTSQEDFADYLAYYTEAVDQAKALGGESA